MHTIIKIAVVLVLSLFSIVGVISISKADNNADLNNHEESLVKYPRMGSVDFQEMQTRFSSEEERQSFYRKNCSVLDLPDYPIIKKLEAKDEYSGTDMRLKAQQSVVNALGAACFGGNKEACTQGKNYFLKYASSNSLKTPNSSSGRIRSLNQYAMNKNFLPSAINFFSVYQNQIGFTEKELLILDKWIKRKVLDFRKDHKKHSKKIYRKYGLNVPLAAGNHYVLSATSSMILGSWLGDEDFFKIGLAQWDLTLGTMREDGSLPHETARGSKAIHYSGLTITKLMAIAEIARVQGIDLYNKKIKDKSFHDAISFYLDAVETPSIIFDYASANRDSGSNYPHNAQELATFKSENYGWIKLYLLRFPNHPNSTRMLNMTGKESYFSKEFVRAMKTVRSIATGPLHLKQSCFHFKP